MTDQKLKNLFDDFWQAHRETKSSLEWFDKLLPLCPTVRKTGKAGWMVAQPPTVLHLAGLVQRGYKSLVKYYLKDSPHYQSCPLFPTVERTAQYATRGIWDGVLVTF